MNVTPINRYNNPYFGSAVGAAVSTGEAVSKSKLFRPVAKQYDIMTDWIAENYYSKFYHSKFTEWFVKKTKNVKNMTTHMSALGATLISGMYTIRTLQNDKLDPEKRKTLALNDVMTWGISTAGSYLIDSKLANWWEKVTTRFAANYVDTVPEAKNAELLGDWNPKNIYSMIEEAPQRALNKINEMKAALSPEQFTEWMKKARLNADDLVDISDQVLYKNYKAQEKVLGEGSEALKSWIKNAGTTEEALGKIGKTVTKSVRDLNLDFLRDRRLTTLIDGMGVLKSLFVFGMIYRYVVPVLVMKPANIIGAYIHKKNEEKAQQAKQA